MRRDVLAAGARSAKFAGGMGDGDIFRNVAPEGERDETVVTFEHAPVIKKIFRPRGTTILVRRVTLEELSPIINTEAIEKEKPAEGTVLVVGKKVVGVIPGEQVVFGKYAGTEFRLNGELLLIMDEDDIRGTVEDEPPAEFEMREAELNVGGCIVGRA
jgi:chaperonin GroES